MSRFVWVVFFVCASAAITAAPTIYPTGTTIYDPEKAWNGYTVFNATGRSGAAVIDMNGNELRRWEDVWGFPPRILPGGHLMGGVTERFPHQENVTVVQQDWEGNIVWQYGGAEQVQTLDGNTIWASRQHHDWQREGNPVGYFVPGADPLVDSGRTLILAHQNVTRPDISAARLEDDRIYELAWNGEVLWEWLASDHVDEFGFSSAARASIREAPLMDTDRQSFDWLHVNSASWVGPNRHFDAGDERFHPENVIISMRTAGIIAIIGRDGDVVWRLGPDIRTAEPATEIRQFTGQHHAHIVPEGLPGAGNLLYFDNGGPSMYGAPTAASPDGSNVLAHSGSQVVELDPVTLEVVWRYQGGGTRGFQFFSPNVSAAQRLPNGNTLITEGAAGRIFEVTVDGEIVWEFLNPNFRDAGDGSPPQNGMYRAYRIPYDWIPQLPEPDERAVVPPALGEFRIEPQ